MVTPAQARAGWVALVIFAGLVVAVYRLLAR